MMIDNEMFNKFKEMDMDESGVSKKGLLDILKTYSKSISVYDLMLVSAELIEDTKYVQENYRKQTNEVYIKYFLLRLNDVNADNYDYKGSIDKEEFIDTISLLKSYHDNESIDSKTKFPLIYAIISLYTTYLLEEPIHPVGTPFPGSLKVEEHDGVYYCPVKDANSDSPNAVCKFCIAEQLEF